MTSRASAELKAHVSLCQVQPGASLACHHVGIAIRALMLIHQPAVCTFSKYLQERQRRVFLLPLCRRRIFFYNGSRDVGISSVTLICTDNSSAPAVSMNIHHILQSLPAVSCLNTEQRLGTETDNDETLFLWLLTQTESRAR